MRKDEFPIVDKLVKDSINEVLDKIEAEIDEKIHHFMALHNTQRYEGLEDAINIIDKYREVEE